MTQCDSQSQTNRGTALQIQMEATHYGLRIAMPISPDEDSLLELLSRIPSNAYHLTGEQGIAFDFQSRACSPTLLVRLLQDVVWSKQVRVTAWLSSNEGSQRLFRDAGLSVTEPAAPANVDEESEREEEEHHEGEDREAEGYDGGAYDREDDDEERDYEYEDSSGLEIVSGSMRSGQHVELPGDVVLWGHLNSGAEISAGGSVVVAGRMQGLVHAGMEGREDVFILAGAFEAPQLRLGRKICYADPSTTGWGKSVLIALGENGTMAIRENNFLKSPGEPPGPWTPSPDLDGTPRD